MRLTPYVLHNMLHDIFFTDFFLFAQQTLLESKDYLYLNIKGGNRQNKRQQKHFTCVLLVISYPLFHLDLSSLRRREASYMQFTTTIESQNEYIH